MKLQYLTIIFSLFWLSANAQQQGAEISKFVYRKPLLDFDKNKPVFKLDAEQAANVNGFLRFSVITGYREGVDPVDAGLNNFAGYTDTVSGTRRIYMFNLSIADMCTHGFVRSSDVILEVKDPSKYAYQPVYGPEKQWLRKNGYCLEFLLPVGVMRDIGQIDAEISHYFGIRFGYEKRISKVLILVRTSGVDKLKSKGIGEGHYDLHGHFNNIPLDHGRFGAALSGAHMPPVVDETGYDGPVDMDLKIADWTDLAAVRKALQLYDLDLKEGERPIDRFVIKEEAGL